MRDSSNRNFLKSSRRRKHLDVVDEDDQFADFNDVSIIDLFTPTRAMKQSAFVKQQSAQSQSNNSSYRQQRSSGTSRNVLCLGLSTFFFFFVVICSFIFWIEPIILERIQAGSRFTFYFEK